jgi:hypothetical protein
MMGGFMPNPIGRTKRAKAKKRGILHTHRCGNFASCRNRYECMDAPCDGSIPGLCIACYNETITHKADISISGQGVYTVAGMTPAGEAWIQRNVYFESWQGNPSDGIAIDGGSMAQDIADATLRAGLQVEVNGRKYLGDNRVE